MQSQQLWLLARGDGDILDQQTEHALAVTRCGGLSGPEAREVVRARAYKRGVDRVKSVNWRTWELSCGSLGRSPRGMRGSSDEARSEPVPLAFARRGLRQRQRLHE